MVHFYTKRRIPKTLTKTLETLLGFYANVAILRLRIRASLAPSNPSLPLQLLAQVWPFLNYFKTSLRVLL
jgi:hypothetical protein